jgi:hypothetical protein
LKNSRHVHGICAGGLSGGAAEAEAAAEAQDPAAEAQDRAADCADETGG